MAFKEDLESLRQLLFGSGIISIDSAIDDVTREIINRRPVRTTTAIELMRQATAPETPGAAPLPGQSADSVKILKDNIKRQTFAVEGNRAGRYSQIDYVYDYNPQIAQALRVYVDNVLSPDFFTKEAINTICKIPEVETSTDFIQTKNQVAAIHDALRFEEEVTDVTSLLLKYGDCFVEILNPAAELVELGVLHENRQLEKEYQERNNSKNNYRIVVLNYTGTQFQYDKRRGL